MSDIDFDELDRAVTSVLNGEGRKAEPEPIPTPAELSKPVAASAQDLHPVAQRPVQRGRFLDMIHPAQAMGPRVGTTVKPLTRPGAVVGHSTNQTFVSDVVSTVAAKLAPVETKPIAEPPSVGELDKPAPPAMAHTPEPAADFFAGGPVEDKPAEPTPSPFIADAKVEKRPLGAFAGAESVTLPVGDELHDKLVAVESEDNVIETAESPIPTKIVEPTPVVSVVTPPAPVESKNTASKQRGLLLPAHSAKNRLDKPPKHGKGTIIWITVLIAVLLIGGGVGASLYFFVLQ